MSCLNFQTRLEYGLFCAATNSCIPSACRVLIMLLKTCYFRSKDATNLLVRLGIFAEWQMPR